jgi:hypothetical protein
LIRILESEDEDEDEDEDKNENDLWADASEDATFVRPAHIIEALLGDDAPTEIFGDGLV